MARRILSSLHRMLLSHNRLVQSLNLKDNPQSDMNLGYPSLLGESNKYLFEHLLNTLVKILRSCTDYGRAGSIKLILFLSIGRAKQT